MAESGATASIDTKDQFTNDPKGWASRWSMELASAEKATKNWWTQADRIVKRFLDIRGPNVQNDTRLNIFTSNIQTLRAIMYGRTPKVDVSRRFDDFNDQTARVAAQMMERLLNTDIEDDEDGYSTAVGHALDDRILTGLGMVKLRYEAGFKMTPGQKAILDPSGEELAPEVPGEEQKEWEDIDFDYYYWKDQLWSQCRTFGEVRWWAFRNYLTKDQVTSRFGKKVANRIPYSAKRPGEESKTGIGQDIIGATPWQRAEVWEIWSKEDKAVYWWVKGYGETLDMKPDPYGLEGFWPFAKPLMANTTTSAFMPRPEFIIAQDLYNEIDYISTRITLIERAVKVVGCYDASNDGVRRLLTEGFDNDLVPVSNWAMFAEKGGLNGVISWLPLTDIIVALDKLREYRKELIGLTYEVTGMSDIIRGASDTRETATAQAIKAKFGSVRMQAAQDEFARFCTDLLELKMELILKLFDDQTIVEQSNIGFSPDAQMAPQAIQMLRSQGVCFRLEVKPESVSLTDYAALRQERTEFITSLSSFVTAMAPLAQQMPGSLPYTLEMLKWVMAAFKGGASIEGVLDQAIAAAKAQAEQPQPPPPPPPQVQVQEARAKADIQVSQAKAATEVQAMQAKTAIQIQADAQKHQQNLLANAQKAQQDLQAMMMKMRADTIQKTGFDPVTGQMVNGGVQHITPPMD